MFVRSIIHSPGSHVCEFIYLFIFVSFISFSFNQKTSTTVLITHVKTVDHAKMVLIVTRVTAQLGTMGTIVRIVSSKYFILFLGLSDL